MADNLFPVFQMPEIVTPTAAENQKYKQSVHFDFDIGDFVKDGAHKMVAADGREAYLQWCQKIVMTERYDHLAYSADIGTELDDAMREPDTEAVKSAVERTITEALMVNKHTEYVKDFSFTREPDGLRCTFLVKGRNWEEQQLGVTISA